MSIDIEKVKESMKRLINVAETLNAQSDLLSKNIAQIDDALRAINVGVECRIELVSTTPSTRLWFGYSRHDKVWGLTLWAEAPDDASRWLFNKAPRWLRIAAVDHIPQLIDALVVTTTDMIEQVNAARVRAEDMMSKLHR